ncbi:hypothetical protein GOP47_0005557 [Adiantum capillus-veneris]|uniref:HECT-type E3 ubiquitin transferase n=1 Tax=Adiantum capillus-veneris TaxID=13818 RepID=A0A9D4ZLH7_ADICA|nr:hypothetical protein GOP47_0005557 [Adiantum capillus-veneris]
MGITWVQVHDGIGSCHPHAESSNCALFVEKCKGEEAVEGLLQEDEVNMNTEWLSSRTTCVKRKLEEMDISATEFRPKRELRDEILEACEEGTLTTSSDLTLTAQHGGFVMGFKGEEDNTCSLNASPRPASSRVLKNRAALLCALLSCHADTSNPMLQFFVRTFNDARTLVVQAHAEDTIELVHEFIYKKTGLPISEQRLIYSGRQLQRHQTLSECQVSNDATLHLVARMLSTHLHRSWQLVNDLVATIHRVLSMTDNGRRSRVLLTQAQDKIRANVKEFLKLAAENVPVSEHMQVFQLAGATSALVVLLLSPLDTNQDCAECSIKLFVSATDDGSSPDTHSYCAPILLDFCKLLRKAAPRHYLYFTCRNALACILDTVCEAHGSVYFNDAKAENIVHDFAPFVTELAVKLSFSLCFTAKFYGAYAASGLPSILHPDAKEGHDFTAFIAPLCKAMVEACTSAKSSIVMDNCLQNTFAALRYTEDDSFENFDKAVSSLVDAPMFEVLDEVEKGGGETGSYAWLFAVFNRLLHEVDSCLKKVEETSLSRPYNWSSVLTVLKGLNVMAKMFGGFMETLHTILHSRSKALNTIIEQLECHNDHIWLLEHKSLLEFESKKRLVLGMLPEPQEDFEERHDIFIHRDYLLSDSFHAFQHVKAEVLQGGLSVEFASEEATGPGVLREWFYLVCKEIFDPENALFLSCPNDPRRVFPNPASNMNPEHLNLFRFSGQVIALALMHKVQVNVVFSSIFFKQLAGLSMSWEDVKDADPVLYQSCKKILELDPELVDMDILGLTFVHEFEELGMLKTVELCDGGKDMVVDSGNRILYVELLVKHRFVTCVQKQVKCFCQGFSDLLLNGSVQQFLQAMEPSDLELMLFGKDANICMEDWKGHTEYHGYESSDCHIIWFWEAVTSMNVEQRRRLLFFSSSIAHLPAEGFEGLPSKFHIHRAHTDITCC